MQLCNTNSCNTSNWLPASIHIHETRAYPRSSPPALLRLLLRLPLAERISLRVAIQRMNPTVAWETSLYVLNDVRGSLHVSQGINPSTTRTRTSRRGVESTRLQIQLYTSILGKKQVFSFSSVDRSWSYREDGPIRLTRVGLGSCHCVS